MRAALDSFVLSACLLLGADCGGKKAPSDADGAAGAVGTDSTAGTTMALGGQAGTTVAPSAVIPPRAVTTSSVGTDGDVHTFTQILLGASVPLPEGIVISADENLWFAVPYGFAIMRVTPGGDTTVYESPKKCTEAGKCGLLGIARTGDGSIWVSQPSMNRLGRLTPSNELFEFELPAGSREPYYMTGGPSGELWFGEYTARKIGRISADGRLTEYAISSPDIALGGVTVGQDGNIWFAASSKVIRMTQGGLMEEYGSRKAGSQLVASQITSGRDGSLWYVGGSRIGRMTTGGLVTEFTVHATGTPFDIAAGADGNLWFTQEGANVIGRITPSGVITDFHLPEIPGATSPSTYHITSATDGSLWFTIVDEIAGASAIGHLVP